MVDDFVAGVVFKERGSFRDVMGKRSSYTSNAMLQAIYGASGPTTPGTGYATPDHAGLILRPGLLVSAGLNRWASAAPTPAQI